MSWGGDNLSVSPPHLPRGSLHFPRQALDSGPFGLEWGPGDPRGSARLEFKDQIRSQSLWGPGSWRWAAQEEGRTSGGGDKVGASSLKF